MFLQLHDGPDVMPSYNGPLKPTWWALDPYATGGPVINPGPFTPFHGCTPQEVYAQFVPQNKDGWKTRMQQVDEAKKLVQNFQSMRQASAAGAGDIRSVPLYDDNGIITGYKAGTRTEEVASWMRLIAKAITMAKEGIQRGEANRLTADAQSLWDQNKWGLQNLCSQSLAQLDANATDCWNSLQWWLQNQSTRLSEWYALPRWKRNNLASPQLAGAVRVSNRSVVLRQNALVLLVREIEAKGGTFDPNKTGGSGLTTAAILALVAGAAFLRF